VLYTLLELCSKHNWKALSSYSSFIILIVEGIADPHSKY